MRANPAGCASWPNAPNDFMLPSMRQTLVSPALRSAFLAVCALTIGVGAAFAAEPDDGTCRNGSFPEQAGGFGVGKVMGPERAYFIDDINGCPNDSAACREKSYVVTGDLVLTGRSKGVYVCAFFPNRGGGSAGWMRRDRLAAQPVDAAPPLSAWVGKWRNFDDTIALKARGAMLEASGDAYWPSANPPLSLRPGGPNTGDFSGVAKPSGARVVFADKDPDGCKVTLDRVGPWLVAADNNNCGGNNVTFTGVYTRR